MTFRNLYYSDLRAFVFCFSMYELPTFKSSNLVCVCVCWGGGGVVFLYFKEGWARNLPCTYESQNDAAADLIHIYAYTKYFYNLSANIIKCPSFDLNQITFYMQEYKAATSPPAYISPLGLGPGAKVWKPSRHRVYGPRNEIYAGKNGGFISLYCVLSTRAL